MRAYKLVSVLFAVCLALVLGTSAFAKGDVEKEAKKAPAAKRAESPAKKANAKKGAAKKSAAKKESEEDEDKDAEAEKAQEEAEAKAEGKEAKKPAKKAAGKDAKKAEEKEEEKPAAEEKDEKKEEKKEDKKEEAPAEEPADEAKPAEEAKPTIALPPAVKKFDKLWEDACQYRAADIMFQGRMRKLLEKAREAESLTAKDNATTEKLAQLANELVEEYNKIKGEKWLLDARMKVRGVEARARTYREDAIKKINLAVERRARAEAEKRAAEEKAAAEAAAAEKLKELVEEEQAKAQEEFDGLARDLKRIDWDRCTRQLTRLRDGMKTREGKDAVEVQLQKVKVMEGMQKHFAKHADKFVFKDRRGQVLAIVMKVDDKTLTIQKARYEKGKPVPDKETRVDWDRFYGLKEKIYLNYMNQFINELVMKGRERTKIGPKEWSEHMLGAALTLQYLYGEEKGVDKFIPVLVKKAVKDFGPCRKWAAKWFPDVELPDAEDPVE
ncbi:MAG: hypothetical protein IJJ84_14065 [Kiritimatiellae bacterium]|nr:hypothetical protein [Kiritimatiellia bacterium]